MEYERIEKVQKGIISPTKLRMKLMGPHHNRKKEGSNGNSSRTSPSRLDVPEDAELAKNSLLASSSDDTRHVPVAVSNADVGEVNLPSEPESGQHCGGGAREMDRTRFQQFRKGDLSIVHPMRQLEEENLDYDSNASSSSFEFPDGGERSNRNPVPVSYPRQIPSKWNDAEKWIMNRQNVAKKNGSLCGQGNRLPVRVAPENAGFEHNNPRAAAGPEKFPSLSFMSGNQPAHSKNLGETKNSSHDTTAAGPTVRSVCMRDMGTEMTPVASQEPSRTATPVGAVTPLRSPNSSLPSTPRAMGQEEPSSSLSQDPSGSGKKELSEQEIKVRTRREIVALGVKLGKMNIAAWASKEDGQNDNNNPDSIRKEPNVEEVQRIEYEKRAASWEEAEKSKHTARYKREEIKIQAWESQQKAKLEAEMRRIEAKVEQMKAQAEAKMVKKIAMARQRSEEKHAAAEARKARDAEMAAAQAEYIRQTGRIPASGYMCCGWFS
ncbi:PREDICTED: uncharacterized protein LOC104820668 isoform X2 [Tarenaya hassleriana]|uniref:uncharacterized protein LOC104820668 isoform X2 n=1 Tax=Tarenaya hassleriana TaxID=28532 RepID=UPI00053C91F8|nr:PREDICTED: uncharacterized protein LOC104820668 isoform X2 [Tarenaya hassleriana]